MKISSRGIALIKEFEGFPNNGCPYRDPIGVWTRGYGRIEGIGPNSPCITEAQASKELAFLLSESYEPAVKALKLPLNQNQYDALVSAVYNLGTGILSRGRTLGDALRKHNWQRAADALMLYVNAGGHPLPGLVRRRNAERRLFLTPVRTPIAFSPIERRLMKAKLTDATRLALKSQALKIQLAARARKGGWDLYDRGRRYQALRKRAFAK